MKTNNIFKLVMAALLAVSLIGLQIPNQAFALGTPTEYVEGQVIAKFKEGDTAIDAIKQDLGVTNVRTLMKLEGDVGGSGRIYTIQLWYIVQTPSYAVATYPTYVYPNFRIFWAGSGIPNDTDFAKQWGLNNTGQTGGKSGVDIDAPEAWAYLEGKQLNNVIVAVLDTGVDYTHEDLAGAMWKSTDTAGNSKDDDNNGWIDDVYGYNVVGQNGNPMDDEGHGTHIAGIIAAARNNAKGIAGVNSSAKIMAVKILDRNLMGTVADAIEGIYYAIKNNAKIINASWTLNVTDSSKLIPLEDAIMFAKNKGILFVGAAGNAKADNDQTPSFPSGFAVDNILSVTSIDHNGQIAGNFGATKVHIAAPGDQIYSTLPGNGYGADSGSSMAAAYTTGVASLILGMNPTMKYPDVIKRIRDNVDKTTELSGKTASGGKLNALRALTNNFNETKIYAGDPGVNANFGWFIDSASIDGDYAVVGMSYWDNPTNQKGSAYIFKRDGNKWNQIAKLTASDGQVGDDFGVSADISGDTVIVGNVRQSWGTGAAYIFVKPADGWKDMTQTAKLTFTPSSVPNPDGNTFGRTVAISGNYAAVAAYGSNSGGMNHSGAVYVFEKSADGWKDMTETAVLKPADAAAATSYKGGMGCSIDISGDYVVAGGSGYSDLGQISGAAYVFKKESSGWVQKQKLLASDGKAWDSFGNSVAVRGNYLIVGAAHNYGTGKDSLGSAYIFKLEGDTWTQKAKLLSSDLVAGDYLGTSVAISDKYAVVGASGKNITGASSGAVYIYEKPADEWKDMTESKRIIPNDGQAGDGFGHSTGISGNYVITSTPFDDDKGTNAGAAYIYNLGGNATSSTPTTASCADPDVKDGLMLHLKLDEQSGTTVKDYSGNNRNGTIHHYRGDTWSWTPGYCGNGLDFTASGKNYITVPDDGGLSFKGAMTVSTWVKIHEPNTRAILIHKTTQTTADKDNYWLAYIQANMHSPYEYQRARFLFGREDRVTDANPGVVSKTVVVPETWYHVAGVFDGTKMHMYVNGIWEASIDAKFEAYTGGADLTIGTNYIFQSALDRNGTYNDGLANSVMDDVRIYNRALSADEVKQLYEFKSAVVGNTLTITPSAATVKPGDPITATLNVKGEKVYGIQAKISSDPKMLFYTSSQYGNVFDVSQRLDIPAKADTALGSWLGAVSLKKPAVAVNVNGSFAALQYEVMENVFGPVTITGDAIFADDKGNKLPVTVINATIIVDDGIHVNSDGTTADGKISGKLVDGDGKPVADAQVTITIGDKTYTTTTDANGNYVFDNLRDLEDGESYSIQACKDGNCMEPVKVDNVDQPVTLPDASLYPGDINGDGKINIADFTLMAASFGLSKGDAGFEPKADLNKDNTVNIQDLTILASHWNN